MPVCMWPSHKTFTQPTWLHLNHKTNQPATGHKETSPQTLPQRVHERERESECTNTNTVYMWFEDIKERKRERKKHKVQGRWHSCMEYVQYHIHVHPFCLSHVGFTLSLIQVYIVHTCMIILLEYQERSTKKTLQGLCNNLIAFL